MTINQSATGSKSIYSIWDICACLEQHIGQQKPSQENSQSMAITRQFHDPQIQMVFIELKNAHCIIQEIPIQLHCIHVNPMFSLSKYFWHSSRGIPVWFNSMIKRGKNLQCSMQVKAFTYNLLLHLNSRMPNKSLSTKTFLWLITYQRRERA